MSEQLLQATIGKIYAAILAIARALPEIKKKSIGGEKAKFDAFVTEDILSVVRPLMLEHGVIVVSRAVERQTEFITTNERTVARHYVFMNHVFIADDGSSIETSAFGEGSGYNEEGLAKAHTRSLGAAIREIFLIVDTEKSNKKEASKNFSQFWNKCSELKITDGKTVLADCGNDPLKAYEFISTRATQPKNDPPPKPTKPSPSVAEPEVPAVAPTKPVVVPNLPPTTMSLDEFKASLASVPPELPRWRFREIVQEFVQVEQYQSGDEYDAIERDRAPMVQKLHEEARFFVEKDKRAATRKTSSTFWNRVNELQAGRDLGMALFKKWTSNGQTDWQAAHDELERSVAPQSKAA